MDQPAGAAQRAGAARRIGFGDAPAVVVVDLTNAFTDLASPVGSDLDGVIEANRALLDAARRAGVPRFFTTISYEPSLSDAGAWALKSSVLGTFRKGSAAVEIDDRLALEPDEPVIVKKGASAFFGTNLAAMLTAHRVDTAIVTGTSTSGCVRATAVDAIQHGFRPIVPRECVGDRAKDPHTASLFDIDAKYGDVLPLAEVLTFIDRLPARRAEA